MKARQKAATASRPGGRWRVPALVVGVAVALVVFVAIAHPPVGVPGQHHYPYHPAPKWHAAVVLACVAVPMVASLGLVLVWRRELNHWQQTLVVAALATGSLFLHAGTSGAGKLFPGAQLIWPFMWLNTEGSYAAEAAGVGPLGRYMSSYPHRLDVSPHRGTPHWVHIHHTQVHPPALIVGFAGLRRFYEAFPSLRAGMNRWIQESFPTTEALRTSGKPSEDTESVVLAMTAALVTLAMVALLPLVCFGAAREVLPAHAALAAAGLAALVPGTHLFNPSIDQTYPTITLLLCWLAFRSARRRGWGAAFGFGVVAYGAMLVHVGFAMVVAVLGVAGVVAWRTERPEWGVGDVVRGCWRGVVASAFGFLTPAFVLLVWLGYPTFRVILLCLRNNALFNAAAGRTWWPWVAVVPWEFAVSLGFALTLVVGVGWVREVAGAVRARSLRGREPLLLAVGGVLLALNVLGLNRGETARLWLFFTPLLVLGAVGILQRRVAEWRVLLGAVCAAQLVQVVAFAIATDLGRTSTFFADMLAAGRGMGQ